MVPSDSMEPLDRVRQLSDSRPELAFELAWKTWRDTGAPEVAETLETLIAPALATFAAPKARRKDDFQAAWLEVSRHAEQEPLATTWLATTFRERLPIDADYNGLLDPQYARRKYAAYFARLDALEPLAPDPVLAAALARFVVDAPLSTWDARSSQEVYGPALQLLARCDDVRQAEVLARLERTPQAGRASTRGFLAGALRPVIDRLVGVTIELDAVSRGAWAELARRRRAAPPTTEDGEALRRVVWERPEEDTARLVYSDWLTERGEPRGELIALQVRLSQSEGSEKERRRAESLLRTHQDEWLGPLRRLLTRVEFRRGFLDRAALAQNAVATQDAWKQAASSDVLRTVRVLEKGRGNSRHYTRFVLSPQMENLRVVELPNPLTLEGLLAGPPRRVEALSFGFAPTKGQLSSAVGHPSLPRLDRLSLWVSASNLEGSLSSLVASGLLSQLEGVTLRPDYTVDPGDALSAARRRLLEPRLVPEVRVEVQTAECTLRREGEALTLDLEDRWGHLTEQFLTAATGVSSAVVRYVDSAARHRLPSLIETLQRAGVEVLATRISGRP